MGSRQQQTRLDVRAVVPHRPRPPVRDGNISRRGFIALVSGVAGGALLAACGGSKAATETPKPAVSGQPSAAPTVIPTAAASSVSSTSGGTRTLVIEAVEYAFKTMGTTPAGITSVQLKNLGQERHEAQFVRLNDGVTLDQFTTALKQTDQNSEPPPIFSFEGGLTQILPGRTTEVLLNLQAGQYVVLCFVDGPDKTPHAMKGMLLPITVTPASGSDAALPVGEGTIALGSGSLALPGTFTVGKRLFQVKNTGSMPRAFNYGRVPADKTPDDIHQAASDPNQSGPPPWYEPVGGVDGLKPGGAAAVMLDLTPGKYAAVDIAFSDDPPAVTMFTVS